MSQSITRTTLAKELQRLGIESGDIVMTHASMRSLGKIDGGAQELIKAQLWAVGREGTLLMVLSADEHAPFDARSTPVDTDEMGVLAEVFRTYPGVIVSDHPADRFGAIGRLATELLEPTPLHDYHGPGSTLERLTRLGGRVLRLGANPDTVTLTHYAEYLADVPNKKRARRRYVRADIGEIWIDSLDDTDGIAAWPHGDYFRQLYLDYRSSGAVVTSTVGCCNGELFDSKDFVSFAVNWMNRELGGHKGRALHSAHVDEL
jgi:aminoglycoside N3'-acetyltransferase